MNGIINDSGFFLEPEALSLLFKLQREVDTVLYVFSSNYAEKSYSTEEGLFSQRVHSVSRLLISAQNLVRWLIEQSTRKLTREDFDREYPVKIHLGTIKL